jgi:hypothetical protein
VKEGGKGKTMRRPEEKKKRKSLIVNDRCGMSKRPP